MCLITDNLEIRVACKDIICYKYGNVGSDGESFYPMFVSDYKYTKGILQPRVDIHIRDYGVVEEGYHAYIKPSTSRSCKCYSQALFINKSIEYISILFL